MLIPKYGLEGNIFSSEGKEKSLVTYDEQVIMIVGQKIMIYLQISCIIYKNNLLSGNCKLLRYLNELQEIVANLNITTSDWGKEVVNSIHYLLFIVLNLDYSLIST